MDGLAYWMASEILEKAKVIGADEATVGLLVVQAYSDDDEPLLRSVAEKVGQIMGEAPTTFLIVSCGLETPQSGHLFAFGTQKILQLGTKLLEQFGNRLQVLGEEAPSTWRGKLAVWTGDSDQLALQNLLELVASAESISTSHLVPERYTTSSLPTPPPGSIGIDEMLAHARGHLQRLDVQTAYDEIQQSISLPDTAAASNIILVDIRPEAQRREYGFISIPGFDTHIIERNVLEWRFDPRHEARLPFVTSYDLRVLVYCQEGYTSSLAAASLQELGLHRVTDLIGGLAEWKKRGLPVG